MKKKIHQYSIGKENLHYFYRFIILPWELKWLNQRFLMSEGDFRKYSREHNINIKSFESTDKLNNAIISEYEAKAKETTGIFWFVRRDTKPKDTLRHLRNCFSHGNFKKRNKNRTPCIVIENIDKGRIKAKGFIPINEIKLLVRAASSCAAL